MFDVCLFGSDDTGSIGVLRERGGGVTAVIRFYYCSLALTLTCGVQGVDLAKSLVTYDVYVGSRLSMSLNVTYI